MQLFGSLKLLMALLGSSWFLLQILLEFCAKRLVQKGFQNCTLIFLMLAQEQLQKKIKKIDNLGFYFGAYLGNFLGFILGPDRPKRGQDEPKRAIRSFKEPKSCIFKNLKKPTIFECFWMQRPPKRTSRGPRRLPRDTQRDTQRWPKNWSKSG